MINIAKFTGAHVVGLNPCEYQLKRVKFHIENNNMQECCIGVKVSFTELLNKLVTSGCLNVSNCFLRWLRN